MELSGVRGTEAVLSKEAVERREFDVLASLYLLRADIDRYGEVRRETFERVYEQELTYLAEGIDAPLITRFEQHMVGGRLEAIDGTPLRQMLKNGLETAVKGAKEDSRYAFHAQRAQNDLFELDAVEAMMRGEANINTIISFSPFPHEALEEHGKGLLVTRGYQPDRKLSFLRIYQNAGDGRLQTSTISLDNSNLDGFRDIAAKYGVKIPDNETSDFFGQYLIGLQEERALANLEQELIVHYDTFLNSITGLNYYQGRASADRINPWDFIESQKDLVGFYFQRLNSMSEHPPVSRVVLERQKIELTYSFWAAMKQRLDRYRRGQLSVPVSNKDMLGDEQRLQLEIANAGQAAAERHERLVGCGGDMLIEASETSLWNARPETALASIMTSETERLEWKEGYCRINECPTRPRKTEVAQCNICRGCQRLFDKGKDPRKEYRRARH